MSFFSTIKELASDMKEISKKSGMDFIVDYVEGERYKDFSFKDLLNELYNGGVSKGLYHYASYLVLMRDYYFYDPYIEKKINAGIAYELDKAHRYYTKNFSMKLQREFKEIFSKYEKEKLIEIVKKYEQTSSGIYKSGESTFYFTYAKGKKKLINHYSCMAAIELLRENYDIEVEIIDLSDENDNDIRAIKNKERMEKAKQTALLVAASVINKYSDGSDNEE